MPAESAKGAGKKAAAESTDAPSDAATDGAAH